MKFMIAGVFLLLAVCLCAPIMAVEQTIQGKEVNVSFSLPDGLTLTPMIHDGGLTNEIGFNNTDHSIWGGVQVAYNITKTPLDPTDDCLDGVVRSWNAGLAANNITGKNITRFELPYKQEVTPWGDVVTVINTPYNVHTVEFRPPGCNATIVTIIAPRELLMNILDFMGFKKV